MEDRALERHRDWTDFGCSQVYFPGRIRNWVLVMGKTLASPDEEENRSLVSSVGRCNQFQQALVNPWRPKRKVYLSKKEP